MSPKHEEEDDKNIDDPSVVGPIDGRGMMLGQRAFQDMFRDAMEGGCVEVGGC